MPKFNITTLGCKVNQAESEAIAQDLLSAEWSPTAGCDQAEVCIVNTCTVTQKASMQSRQAIRQAIRSNPDARIIVTGCYAQCAPQEINKIEGVDYIVGHDDKLAISRLVRTNGDRTADNNLQAVNGGPRELLFQRMPAAISAARTRPFLKVQDGCDAFCTYCIVPYARGRSRSLPLNNVLQSVQKLAEAGYHEVVLTGIHLGAYGRDLSPAVDLAQLLRRIQESALIDRVRLSSIEPLELSREIIQIVAESDMFCRHFHIPLQSGDDRVLKKMGRPYSRLAFQDLILRLNDLVPDAAIGADVLIGFPGEDEQAFDNTYSLLEGLPVSYLHVFPFSARPGTPAAKFTDHIPRDIIKDRCDLMRRLGQDKRVRFYRQSVGKTLPLLIETRRDAASGLLKGMSSNYLPVLIDAGDECKNKIIDVKVEKLKENKLYGIHTD